MAAFKGQNILNFAKELTNDDAHKIFSAKIITDKWHIQAYFDDFCFRINRFPSKQSLFHKTIERMDKANPIYQKNIKQILSV